MSKSDLKEFIFFYQKNFRCQIVQPVCLCNNQAWPDLKMENNKGKSLTK